MPISAADILVLTPMLSAERLGNLLQLTGSPETAIELHQETLRVGAALMNITSRGPLVDEPALLEAVQAGRIIAALDVFDREPLPLDHPLRTTPNTILTPHLGYGVDETWREFYPQSVENALAFLDGRPIRVVGASS